MAFDSAKEKQDVVHLEALAFVGENKVETPKDWTSRSALIRSFDS